MTPAEVAARHPVRPGVVATEPTTESCPHHHAGMWARWEWRPARDETEETSEPVVLEVPATCHECNCDDPTCARCFK